MKQSILGLLGSLLCSTVSALETPEKDETEIVEQPLISVSSDVNSIPEPLVSEAKAVASWPGATSLITSENWAQQNSIHIKDLLDFVPGIFAQQRNGAESARVSIRGSGLGRQFQGGGLLLLLDGIPLNTADGAFDFQAIDPWLIDYITAYRGANGMAMGGFTLGGVVNLASTQANNERPNSFRLASGSFGTMHGMIDINSQLSNHSLIRIKASHFKQDGFREQNQQNSNRFSGQYIFNTNNNSQHKFRLYHLNSYAELPSSLSKNLIFDNPRQSRGFNITGNFHRNLTLSQFGYSIEKQLGNQQIMTSFFAASKDLINPVFTYINRESDDVGISFHWKSVNHQVQLNAQQGWQDERRRENESGFAGDERLFRKQQAFTTTMSWQYQKKVVNPQTTLQLGLQGIYASRNIDERRPLVISSKRSYQQLNPFIGIRFQATENQQWFTNLSHSFEPPTFAELNNGNQPGINTPIKAQSANTIELGTRGFNQQFNWDMALYYSQLDNEFIRFRFPNGDTRTTNANNSIHFGFEAGLKWQLADGMFSIDDSLIWQSSYQWNQFKLNKDPVYHNNKIPGIPEHYIQNKLVYAHPSGWQISPKIEWVPSGYFVDLANSYRTENYLITGLSMSYNTSNKIDMFLDINNLNNQTYISTTLPIPDAQGTDGNYFYSGEGRSIHAGLSIKF